MNTPTQRANYSKWTPIVLFWIGASAIGAVVWSFASVIEGNLQDAGMAALLALLNVIAGAFIATMDDHRIPDGQKVWAARELARAMLFLLIAAVVFVLAVGGKSNGTAQFLVSMPNSALTPGAVATSDAREVCEPGYARAHRDVSIPEKQLVYARYSIVYIPRIAEMDHLVPLEAGGDNSPLNLWPEPFYGTWNAHVKDELENEIHAMACSGQVDLRSLQLDIAHNWIDLYRRVFGVDEPRRSRKERYRRR